MHGLFVRRPFASALVHGTKTVETRSYRLPLHLIGQTVYVIETPCPRLRRQGDRGMIIGKLRLEKSFQYASREHWLSDQHRHLVLDSHPLYGWRHDRPKFGWVVAHLGNEVIEPCLYRGTGCGRVWVTDCEPVVPYTCERCGEKHEREFSATCNRCDGELMDERFGNPDYSADCPW